MRRVPGSARRRADPVCRRAFVVGLVCVVAASCTRAPPTAPASPSRTGPPRITADPSAPASPPGSPSPAAVTVDPVEAAWTRAMDAAVGGREVSVAVGVGDRIVYVHDANVMRIPASNEKLLTSMAVLDAFGPGYRIPTSAATTGDVKAGVLRGDLWLIGAGDPELTGGDLAELATRLRAGGLRRVSGRVLGDTGAFGRGWWAPGWVPGLSRDYVTRTTALAIDGNEVAGMPEQVAAATLTSALERSGVVVGGAPGTGAAPAGPRVLASVRSDPLREILARQNHDSVNFDAEMLTKALGARTGSAPGSTAGGAAAVEAWAAAHGVHAEVRDGSGLSHLDRVSAAGLVTLLLEGQAAPWADVLWASLPAPGEGTLAGRLLGAPVRAKTGTLFETPVSALSGYVTSLDGRRMAFAVISRGLEKSSALGIEDAIVRALAGIRAP